MRLAGFLPALAAFAIVSSSSRAAVAGDERRAPAAPSTAAASAARARFTGAFRFAGSAHEEEARKKAIDRGIDGLFFAIRGIARSRLSSGTKIDPWIAFSFDSANIRVRFPSSAEAVSPESGAVVDYVNDDDRTKLSQRLSGSKITQVFVAEEGRRVNEWVLSPDSKKLSVKVTIASPKLTRDVVYVLTYQRLW